MLVCSMVSQVRAIAAVKQAGCRNLPVAAGCTSCRCRHMSKPHAKRLSNLLCNKMTHPPTSCLPLALPAAGLPSLCCFFGWNGEWNMRGCTSKDRRDVKDLMLDVVAAPTTAWTVRIKSTPYSNYWTFPCQLECRQDLISSTELSLCNQRIGEQKMHSKAVHDKIIPTTTRTLNSYRSE